MEDSGSVIRCLFVGMLACAVLMGCGGSSDVAGGAPTPRDHGLTGVFINAPVVNLSYRVGESAGQRTSSRPAGGYRCLPGDTLQWRLGAVVLGHSACLPDHTFVADVTCPGEAAPSDRCAINLATFLQAHAPDGAEQITVSDQAHGEARGFAVDFRLPPAAFAAQFDDGAAQAYLAARLLDSGRSSLPDAAVACENLGASMAARGAGARRPDCSLPDQPVAPQADAGPDQWVSSAESVVLDGSASRAADDTPLTFSWQQVGGPAVALQDADQAMAHFVAPEVVQPTVLAFRLTVTDVRGLARAAITQVYVVPIPGCDDQLLCAGAASERITPAQRHIDGMDEPRALGSRHFQQFNLGGFGFDVTQNVPEPFGSLGQLLTEAAAARLHINARGQEEHTWVRAMLLSERQVDGSDQQVVFLVIDAIGAGNVITNALKQQVSAATGIAPDNILFGQTHSHAGADLQGLWGGVPQDWIDTVLYPAAVRAVKTAQRTLCPARLHVGQIAVPELNNYRRPRVDEAAQADPAMTLLQARCAAGPHEGAVRASLLQYNAHPVGIGAGESPRVPHADYILGAVERLEDEFGGVALYFNGPIADASTAGSATGNDAYERVRSRGEQMARRALDAPMRELAPTLSVRHQEATLPVTNPLFVSVGALGAFNRYYDFLTLPLGDIPFLGEQLGFLPQTTPTASTVVSRVTVGGAESGLEIVTLPGEATNTFGQYVRALAHPDVDMMLLGLTQQSFGYIIPEEEFSYLDPAGGSGFLLPFTQYEEYVSLGPLTAPLLRLQAYHPLFDVDPLSAQNLPPWLLACYDDPADSECILTRLGQQLDFIQAGLVSACEEAGLPGEFCGLLDPQGVLPGDGGGAAADGPLLADVCRGYARAELEPLCQVLDDAQTTLQDHCGLLPGGLLCGLTSGTLNTLVQTCDDALPDTGPLPLCQTVDTVIQGAASFCRQVSTQTGDVLVNEFCSLIGGEHINERAIAAFERSWAGQAMALQNRLGLELPWVHTQILATHNSFNATTENMPPTLSGFDANQFYGVVDQLRMGVRGLELDVHWMPRLPGIDGSLFDNDLGGLVEDLVGGVLGGLVGGLVGGIDPAELFFEPVVCHGNVQHFGCTYERSLESELQGVRQWLDAHPDEVLIIDLEANLSEPLDDVALSFQRAAEVFDQVLGDLIYQPAAHGATCDDDAPVSDPTSWLNVSRAQMLAAGRPLMIYTGTCADGNSALWADLFHRKRGSNHVQSARQDFTDYRFPACDFDRHTHRSRWTRFYEDGTLVGAITGSSGLRVMEAVPEMLRCGVNMPSPDFLLPDQVSRFVWSWAEHAPGDDLASACAYLDTDGRFGASRCDELRPHACVADQNPEDWRISAAPASWQAASCPAGYHFAVPGNAYFNEQLKTARDAAGVVEVWLNYRRRDDTPGRWITNN
ncbi:PKD domain-containing protein [Isoalcanivorax indicus]|uniref:PKD domain-containing protein n=1 Tax=Isoalcanivorax indicus TaxID=2202653 RepID=UPI000DBA7283|nr:hypothetical protein [Isoalcanivorax indicus]